MRHDQTRLLSESNLNPKRITLRDVAKEAGLSMQTVSHVLSGNPTVRLPESTRARVRAAVDKVGYQPNRHAQAIRGGKTNLISVWMPVDQLNLAYLQYLRVVSEFARRDNYELMVNCLQHTDALLSGGKPPTLYPVDGIISIDSGKAIEAFRQIKGNDITPISILGFERVPFSDSVAWNLDGAAKQATYSLISQGAKSIALVTPKWVYDDFPRERRRRGYSEAMEEAGLPTQFIPYTGETSAEIKGSICNFLEENRIDAAICFNDAAAMGTIRALQKIGLSVPNDVMVIGYGNYPEAADFSVPISTIRLPIDKVMAQAWTWLTERIKDPALEPRFTVVEMEIIHRESSQRF